MFGFSRRPQLLPEKPPAWWDGDEESWEIHRDDMNSDALRDAEYELKNYYEESEED